MIFLTHPQHGTHIAYTDLDVALCEKSGWKKMDAPVAEPDSIQEPAGELCSKGCGKVLARGRTMHEKYCKGKVDGE